MIVTSSANRYYTFYRRTAFVTDERDLALTMTPDRQPAVPSYVDLRFTVASGGYLTATITVSGFDADDNAITEDIAFTAGGTRSTTKQFKSITQFAASGTWSGVKFTAAAISADGTSNLIRYTVAASRPAVWVFSGFARSIAYTQGQHDIDSANVLIDFEEAWAPRIGDIAISDNDGETWEVFSVREEMVGFGYRPHFFKLRFRRLEN